MDEVNVRVFIINTLYSYGHYEGLNELLVDAALLEAFILGGDTE